MTSARRRNASAENTNTHVWPRDDIHEVLASHVTRLFVLRPTAGIAGAWANVAVGLSTDRLIPPILSARIDFGGAVPFGRRSCPAERRKLGPQISAARTGNKRPGRTVVTEGLQVANRQNSPSLGASPPISTDHL
jgi:hypothetical protein